MTHEVTGKLELLFAHLSIHNISSIKPLLLDALDEYYTIQRSLSYSEKQEMNFIKRLLYHAEREEWIQARECLNSAQKAYQTYLKNKMEISGYDRNAPKMIRGAWPGLITCFGFSFLTFSPGQKIGYAQIHGKDSTRYVDETDRMEIGWIRDPDEYIRVTGSSYQQEDRDTYSDVPRVAHQYHAWRGSNLTKQPVIKYRLSPTEEQGPERNASFLKPPSFSFGDYPGSYSNSHETSQLKPIVPVVGTIHPTERSPRTITSKGSREEKCTETSYDPNKPYYIAEAYHNLYEKEWMRALAALSRMSLSEETAVECLINILHEAYNLSEEEARTQIVRLEHAALNIISDGKYSTYDKDIFGQSGDLKHMLRYRKEVSELSVKRLQENFLFNVLPIIHRRYNVKSCDALDEYSTECVSVTWRMVIQEPPLYLDFIDPVNNNYEFNPKMYKLYKRSGKLIDYLVWPALRMHRKGMVICRGVVQCK